MNYICNPKVFWTVFHSVDYLPEYLSVPILFILNENQK